MCNPLHKSIEKPLATTHTSSAKQRKKQQQRTPLMLACQRGHLDTVRDLLATADDVDAVDAYGATALLRACQRNHTTVVCLLLLHKANPDIPDSWGETPLLWAIKLGHFECLRLIIEHGANLDGALLHACQNESIESARLLLQHGSRGPNAKSTTTSTRTRGGMTPLMFVTGMGWMEWVKLLLANGFVPDIRALHLSLLLDRVDILELFLELGVCSKMQDMPGLLELTKSPDASFLLVRHCPQLWYR